jgi:pimeloyl-ACP methyl ester carboxylesterase
VGVITIAPEDAKNMFYQDLDDETVAELAKDLQPQSLGAYWSKTTYAAWRVIPTTYIVCTKDVPSTVAAAKYFVKIAKENEPNKIDDVFEMETGHCPFISEPGHTAEKLIAESKRRYGEEA